MKYIAPMHLYKYKALSTAIDLANVLDIIMHNRIYVPILEQLNDPMEGYGVVHTGSYAGSSFSVALELQGMGLNHANDYRVLSLTELYSSPQMWAHYGGGYTGICIQFNSMELPFEVTPVRYAEHPIQLRGEFLDSDFSSDEISKGALAAKHVDWAYEQEWRAILGSDEIDAEGYVRLGSGNPSAVILGSACSMPVAKFVCELCRNASIPLYKTYLANWTQRVRVTPYEMTFRRDGMPLKKQVEDYCNEYKIEDINNW